MRSVLADVSPLRDSPGFRRLWASGVVSGLGGQIGLLGITYQVYSISGSTLAVGLLGLTVLAPQVVIAPVGGLVADRHDRRTVLLVTGAGLVVVSAGLAAYGFSGNPALWPIYGLAVAQTTLSAFAVPARRAIVRSLLPAKLMPAGSALSLFSMHFGSVLGPLAGGALAGIGGTGLCYAADAASYCAALWAVARLPRSPRAASTGGHGPGGFLAGLGFLQRHSVVRATLLCDGLMTVLGVPVALFPALNAALFGGQPQTLGALSSAIAVGGILGAVFSGFAGRVRRQSAALAASAMAWAAAVCLIGFIHQFAAILALLALTGALDVFCLTFAKTIVQNETPDEVRGRVSSVEFLVSMGGPQLGNVRAGLVAGLLPVGLTIALGGASALVAIGLLSALQPAWRRYVVRSASEAEDGPTP